MKVKQTQIVKAYKAIVTISDRTFDLSVTLPLFKLKQALKAQYEFQIEQERKIARRFSEGVDEASGEVSFASKEEKNEFLLKVAQLLNMTTDVAWDRITIAASDLPISVKEIESLSPFLDFEPREIDET